MTAIDSFFGGASLVHPSFVDVKDAEKAGAPLLALPSKDEPDMVTMATVGKDKLKSKRLILYHLD